MNVLAASLSFLLAASTPGGPTVAKEDTMHTEVSEVLVRAPRATLAEILDRVARGEARRDSLMNDQVFTATLRVMQTKKDGEQELLNETVTRVFKKRPRKTRSVLLRHIEPKTKKKRTNVEVNFRGGMDEEIVNFAFRPENRREFKYRIVGREILGQNLVYRIAFEPRSRLDPSTPSGVVWVNTNEFVIVRQEVVFDRSPAPLFLKGIERMVIERQNVDGFWVLRRVLLRAAANLPLPVVGRNFDLSLLFDGYAINRGVPDAIFDAGGSAR